MASGAEIAGHGLFSRPVDLCFWARADKTFLFRVRTYLWVPSDLQSALKIKHQLLTHTRSGASCSVIFHSPRAHHKTFCSERQTGTRRGWPPFLPPWPSLETKVPHVPSMTRITPPKCLIHHLTCRHRARCFLAP